MDLSNKNEAENRRSFYIRILNMFRNSIERFTFFIRWKLCILLDFELSNKSSEKRILSNVLQDITVTTGTLILYRSHVCISTRLSTCFVIIITTFLPVDEEQIPKRKRCIESVKIRFLSSSIFVPHDGYGHETNECEY